MKRVVTVLVSLCLMLSLCVTVSADEAKGFDYVLSTVERAEGEKIAAGEEFAVEVSLTAIDKLAMVEYHFRYDKTLMEPVSATTEGFLLDCIMQSANIAPARNDAESETYGEVWITGMADSDKVITEGEVISTIVFKAKTDITEDSPMVGYYADGCDAAFSNYECGMINGGIVIGEADAEDIPAEMTAPINNAVPTGNILGGDAADGEQSEGGPVVLIAVIVVGVLAAGVLIVLLVMAKKK